MKNKSLTLWPWLSVALLLGIILRLSFPGDIEYKSDEKYMFEATQRIGVTESWPLLGMTSGPGIKNPGMSVWLFVVLAKITHASTPLELARAVQLLNILALLLLAFFGLRLLTEPERITWFWATAFAAVNPFAVLLQRKIWAQSTLPFFCLLFWIAWHYRHKRGGAFFWGLLGVCLGQIHMSGFFLAAGVFIWTALYDRRTKWVASLLGSLAGVIPLIPWLQYLTSKPAGNGFDGLGLLSLQHLRFWRYWVTDSLGIGLSYSLGKPGFMDFLRYPVIGGTPTYLVAVLHAVIILIGLFILVSAIKTGGLWKAFKNSTETGLAVNAVLLGTGLLMSLSGFELFRHYLMVSFPLEWVWLSRIGLCDSRWGQKCLILMGVAQLLISISFLAYIHINHGAPLGDYGTAYQFQSGSAQ